MTFDWSPLAIATVVLACVAVWAILQTRGIQKGEYRRTLLSEIIAWATDVVDAGFGPREERSMPREDELREQLVRLSNRLFRYQAMDTRSRYITRVAQVFGKELHSAVLAVIRNLNDVRVNIPKCIDSLADEATVETLNASEHKLRESAIKLIEQATKIKTRDIG